MRYLLLLLIVLSGTSVSAEMYQWKDDDGVFHMSTEPPPNSVKNVQTVREDDGLPSKNIAYLDTLYTRESFMAEKETLKKQLLYYQTQCLIDSKYRQQQTPETYCSTSAEPVKRSLDVLSLNPDRYFYVKSVNNNSTSGLSRKSPYYNPW